MHIKENISLKNYNTFGIDVRARYFTEVSRKEELLEVLSMPDYPEKLILGGGSNILLTGDVEKLVVHIRIRGISVTGREGNEVLVKAGAGENWHSFVLWTLEKGYGGLENLSLIPGNVGTAPIQNIGAYGVELKDVFESCEAVEIGSGKTRIFSREECRFGYRDSIFKREARGRYIITGVTFRLRSKEHRLHIHYGAISQVLAERGISSPGIKDVSDAVISIRQSKLPDPRETGNSGSFFKNPVVPANTFRKISEHYPEVPSYPLPGDQVKIPAGWLIEQCGFKGKRFGAAGVHHRQALVLVNYGGATGQEIWQLATHIREKVNEKFGILLEPEVNIL
ncbi:UDP-N-acetylmuramate dehydrogenase [Sinomicrobium soli]|uniref:UDP-N-acetylmuramate dehydrogenase n=1 Tax=Sinomicrobium sp. N-1-3-6 TaxID=2219864 RepID=UPI000DCAF87F|nr:UDP-N-acetylmuramate dehydrogenase [Sinomicrobium sp. N-1-3-6]RAV30523.1 UDP-N-acetylenolpyruvoylglucosamine reductase [Sinomicrobium sp. N-1-3-6]